MQSNISGRPQTSKYRNQSQILFGDQPILKQQNQSLAHKIPKKRPQSYRNISKMAQFMNDSYLPIKQMHQVHYSNLIQNRDQRYEIPKTKISQKNEQSLEFDNFFERASCKFYKPLDQFTQYTDLMRKNSALLRRGQFSTPIQKGIHSITKINDNTSKISFATSKYYTKTGGGTYHTKFQNSIQGSLNQSIKQKKMLKKQKQIFTYKTQKYIKPINKTFLGYAEEYKQMLGRQRQNKDKKSFKNAMDRVLTVQSMNNKIKGLTRFYV